MPDWTAFGAVAGLVLSLVLGLAWITSGAFASRYDDSDSSGAPADPGVDAPADAGVDAPADGRGEATADARGDARVGAPEDEDAAVGAERSVASDTDDASPASPGEFAPEVESIPTTALLANVLFTHGGLGVLLVGAAAMTAVPAAALGVAGTAWSTGALAVGGGLAAGSGLALANVALAASLDRIGLDHDEGLRTAMAPDSALGWAILLVLVLPLVAAFEELLFRAVLIGAAAAATGISPWPFVPGASIAFALGHGLQGRGGILVTGLLGGALGVAFVLTNSLLLVVVAHYVVNAVEFLGKEWLGLDLDGGF